MTISQGALLDGSTFGLRPENVEIPFVSTSAPSSSQFGGIVPVIGKRWINTTSNTEYVLTSALTSAGVTSATWTLLGTNSGALNTLSDDSSTTVTPVAGNIQIAGTANQIATTAGAGVITLSLIGPFTPSTFTAHGVLIGEGTSSVVATTPGTNGQVLIGSTGADPAFATVTSSGSTITITGGAHTLNIDVTAPLNVAHGGTGATTLTGVLTGNGASAITASTVTQHGVIVAGASNAVASLTVGTDGQVLTGNTGADPSFGAIGVKSGLTAHGVLLAEGASAFVATSAGTDGEILIAATGADPAFGHLTPGAGIIVTEGANTLSVGLTTGGFTLNAASTGATLAAQNSYTVTQAAQTSFALPAVAAVGDTFLIAGAQANTAGWIITQGAGQEIWADTSHTTSGATGTLAGAKSTSVVLMCVVANNEFVIIGGSGLTGLTFT